MIGLVFIDVDGTLVGASGTVPPETWAAAARLRSGGTRLAVCSGRPAFGDALEYARRLEPAGWHAFQTGASVLHLGTGESRSTGLPADAVALLVERARASGLVLELYTDTGYAVESRGDRARRHAGLLGVPFAPRSFASLPGRVVRAQWLVAHAEAGAVLAERHPGMTVTPSYSPVMPDTTFVNLTPAGVDKASAVRVVAREYGVPLERVMVVGDGSNDAPAMRAVGFPVAMGNAEPEARDAARYEVGHVDRGGLAEALALALEAS